MRVEVLAGFRAGASITELAGRLACAPSEIERVLRAELATIRAAATHADRQALALRALDFTARRHGLTIKAAIESRGRPAVLARWAAWLALLGLGWSRSAVARAYGMDHTTILHAARRAPADLTPLVEAARAHLCAGPEAVAWLIAERRRAGPTTP